MNPEVIELTTTDRTKISFSETQDDVWFSFWVDNAMLFSEIPAPTATQQIPLPAETRFMYKRPQTFFVKWQIGDKVFLTPFEK